MRHSNRIGDFYRYKAEYASGESREIHLENAVTFYDNATVIADNAIQPNHPVTLALAVNRSILYFEELNFPHKAYRICRTAFENAASFGTSCDLTASQVYQTKKILDMLSTNIRIYETEISKHETPRIVICLNEEEKIASNLRERGVIP